jgi:hypothetical protein
MLRFKIKSFFKFVTALRVSAYSAIIRCPEIRGNFCAFSNTAIAVFIFIMFLNEVTAVPPSMLRALSSFDTPVAYGVCSMDVSCITAL